MLPIAINTLLVIHVLVSLLIIFLVLMQRPKNEGLGAAFGGGMTENLFGAQTTNVLQTITRWLGGIFFALTLLLSWLYVKQTTWRSSVQQKLSAPTTVPAAPAPPAGAASGVIPAPTDPASPSDVSPPVSLPTPTPGAANTPATTAPQNPATPATTPLEKSSETPAPGSPRQFHRHRPAGTECTGSASANPGCAQSCTRSVHGTGAEFAVGDTWRCTAEA